MASEKAPEYHAASEAAIEAGRQHYAARRYKPALEQFTRVMRGCPCYRGMKRERCSCKDFEKVAAEDGSLFKEAMYNCKCAVGRTFNKCDKAAHIQALDYRAATFEALEELDRARRDAEWMLELAPRLPDGYLRLGKIARLQKKNDFAWSIYNAGIEVGLSNGHEKSPKMEQLYKARQPLQLRYLKRDPMQLPFEIAQLIFSSLDLVTLVRCLRVCKSWRQALTGQENQRLWKSLKFTGSAASRVPPSSNALRKLLANSGHDLRELVIESGDQFSLTNERFHLLLRSAKNLERLELWSLTEPIDLPSAPKNLTHLVVRLIHDARWRQHYCSVMESFMLSTAETLQSLHATYMIMFLDRAKPLIMPQLKYFICEGEDILTSAITFLLPRLVERTPNLEQLVLKNVSIEYNDIWPEGLRPPPTLRYLRIVEGRHIRPLSHDLYNANILKCYSLLTSFNDGNSFQALDISLAGDYSWSDPFFSSIISDTRGNDQVQVQYTNIESFRLKSLAVKPNTARNLFNTALLAGKLHTFDIVFPLDGLNERIGESSAEHLDGYSWLKGAESIRSMGLFSFSFSSLYSTSDEMPLLSFLKSFPNLEVLELDTNRYEDAGMYMLLKDVMTTLKGLKTLHQYRVKGVMLDQLLATSESCGVSLVWGERPRQWPMQFNHTLPLSRSA